ARLELAEQRRDARDRKRVRRRDAQPAARSALQLTDRALRLVELVRDALRVLEVDVAGFRETELARGPVQQLCAQAGLQVLDLATDRRLRQSQCACGGNEAAVLDHLGKNQRVVEIAVHGSW